MKFAEFYVGQIIEAGPIQVSEVEIIEFAKQFDPQWFHINPEEAATGHFDGLIASGWHTCCLVMRLIADKVLEGSESYASPGLAYLKWMHPVRPNDALSVKAHVLEVRFSASNPSRGILRWRWDAFQQDNIQVLELEATSMFDMKIKR
jgi:acyl dehydratase